VDQIRALQIAVKSITADLRRIENAIGLLADATTSNTAGNITQAAATQRANNTQPGLAVGTTDITITWPLPWPDTAYLVIPTIICGTAALGSLHATLKQSAKTPADCVITVANTGAATVGQYALDVLGIRT